MSESPVKTDKRGKQHHLIASLLGDPELTRGDIAEMVGVSTKTVQRVAKKVELEAEGCDGKLEQYRRHIQKHMPIEKRVKRYVELAEDDHRPTALNALIRLDHLDSVVTPREAGDKEQKAPQAMPAFILPPGTQVQVNTPPPGEQEKRIEGKRIDENG